MIEVTSQGRLDDVLAGSPNQPIIINAPRRRRLYIGTDRTGITIVGRSRVTVGGDAFVRVRDNAAVTLLGESRAEVFGNAIVHATEYSRACISGGAVGYATACAHLDVWRGQAFLGGNAMANVSASQVVAKGNTYVSVYGSGSRVVATAGVAIRQELHARNKIVGGTVLHSQEPQAGLCDRSPLSVEDWAREEGTIIEDGRITLYKATDENLIRGSRYHLPTRYAPGTELVAVDWVDSHECGGGLHLSPQPLAAAYYAEDVAWGKHRFLRVTAAVEDVRVIGNKVKVRACRVEEEVNAWGDRLVAPTGDAEGAENDEGDQTSFYDEVPF